MNMGVAIYVLLDFQLHDVLPVGDKQEPQETVGFPLYRRGCLFRLQWRRVMAVSGEVTPKVLKQTPAVKKV